MAGKSLIRKLIHIVGLSPVFIGHIQTLCADRTVGQTCRKFGQFGTCICQKVRSSPSSYGAWLRLLSVTTRRNVRKRSRNMWMCANSIQNHYRFVSRPWERTRISSFFSPQVVTALALYLPTSDLYPVLSSLPPPDATNPDATTTFAAQSAIQDSLPIIQEIVQILEKYEETTFTQEVDKRRKRLGAPSPDVIRREVGYEICSESRVRASLVYPDLQMTFLC